LKPGKAVYNCDIVKNNVADLTPLLIAAVLRELNFNIDEFFPGVLHPDIVIPDISYMGPVSIVDGKGTT